MGCIVNGPGEKVFPALLKELETGTRNFSALPNLIFKNEADELPSYTIKKPPIWRFFLFFHKYESFEWEFFSTNPN